MSAVAERVTFSPPAHRTHPGIRPALLVAEFRGVGDIAILIPFLRAALTRYDVTLLAVPNAAGLLRRFVPEVELIPCVAPWALFSGGRNLPRWPWRALGRVARPGHLLGYGPRRAGWLLDENLADGGHIHRPEAWRRLAARLNLPPYATHAPRLQPLAVRKRLVLHSGASQALRVWPLHRYAEVLRRLRDFDWNPVVLCDPGQVAAWRSLGEPLAHAAGSMDELIDTIASGAAFLGNDSGPGHIAALCGVPTFTIFGPQVPELFAPAHANACWIEGRPCPHKPCYDRCHYAEPFCLTGLDVEAVWPRFWLWLAAANPPA